jgi:Ca2+-binding EF-hand superfamily protein/WD40 repeat protein/serine/threonine protein kinase
MGGVGGGLREGMKVEARYRGKSRYYTGVIKRANRDGTYDIDYDDGEKEMFVAEELVRSLETSQSCGLAFGGDCISDLDINCNIGDRVEALFRGKGSKWFPGRVSRVNRNGTYDIDYDDEDHESDALPNHIRLLNSTSVLGQSHNHNARLGMGESKDPLPGRLSNLSPRDSHTRVDPRNDNLIEGTRVEFRIEGRSGFIGGIIARARSDGTFDIELANGEIEKYVEPAFIRSLERMSLSRARKDDPDFGAARPAQVVFPEGHRVAVGLPVMARVLRVSRDGRSVDVQFYDDDRTEKNVDIARLAGAEGKAALSALRVGDEVEANYRGRGKYYPGIVSALERDDTFEIRYKDGDREDGVNRDQIKSLSDLELASGDPYRERPELRTGAIIDVRRWYPGRVLRAPRRAGGAYDVKLVSEASGLRPSVAEALGIEAAWVRGDPDAVRRAEVLTETARRSGAEAAGGGAFAVGQGVEACWRRRSRGGKPSRTEDWAAAQVTKRHPDGTYTVMYLTDDQGLGDVEDDVPEDAIRADLVLSASDALRKPRPGDRCEVRAAVAQAGGRAPSISATWRGETLARDLGREESKGGSAMEEESKGGEGKEGTPRPPENENSATVRDPGERTSGLSTALATEAAGPWWFGEVQNVHSDGTVDVLLDARDEGWGEAASRVDGKLMNLVWGDDARFPRRKRSRSWQSLEHMALALWERRGSFGKAPSVKALLSEADELTRCEKLLGGDEMDRLRRAFDRADVGRDGVIDASDALVSFAQLGRRALKSDLATWLAARPHPTSRRRQGLDFLEFVKAFAGVFFARPEDKTGPDASTLPGSKANATLMSGTANAHGRLSVLMEATANGGHGGALAYGGDEAAELERWAQKLGRKQFAALEEVFRARATPVRSGRLGLRVRDLRPSMVDLGYDCSPNTLTTWLASLDLHAGDALSLPEFAYAFFSLFIDPDGRMPEYAVGSYSGPMGRSTNGDAASLALRQATHRDMTGPRRLDGGLLPMAEVAALVFQEDAFTGTPDQHARLVRRCAIGRSDDQVLLLNRARDAFEALDKDADGEIQANETTDWLLRLGIQRVEKELGNRASGGGGKNAKTPLSSMVEEFVSSRTGGGEQGHVTNPATSTVFLPELIVAFGFLLEAAGNDRKPTVAAAFAMLRLHASQPDTKVCAETVLRYLDNMLRTPRDQRLWKVSATNSAYQARVGRHRGGPELMAAVGFSESANKASALNEAAEWLVLEGTANAKAEKKGLPSAQLEVLAERRSEVEAEMAALEGAPSVGAAVRACRAGGASLREVQAAVATVLLLLSNVLKNPKDPRVFRVKTKNARFATSVGRLAGGIALMEAAGFVLVDGGAALEVLPLGAPKVAANKNGDHQEPSNASFKFPSLDSETEAFLYRRKADLEAVALDLENDSEAHQGVYQSDSTRAQLDASDALTSAKARGQGVSSGKLQPGDVAKGHRLGGAPKPKAAKSKMPTKDQKYLTQKNGKETAPSSASALLQEQVSAFMKGKTEAQMAQLSMLKAAFLSLDVNGDGFIDASDLQHKWRLSGQDASERRAVAWVRARDMNADNRVAFDEFVASFAAQLAPSDKGWEKECGTANALLIEDGDEVGATAVQKAVGALRLRASLPECVSCLSLAIDLLARAVASPAVHSHWRIDLSQADVHRRLGRFNEGVALLRALGFEPEANGSIMALRDPKGAKWLALPPERVAALKMGIASLEAQMRGLEQPDVADVQAVAAAVAALRDKKGSAAGWAKAIKAILDIVENILKEEADAAREGRPGDPRHRTLSTDAAAFTSKIGPVDGGLELLVALGFREASGGGALHLPRGFDLQLLRARAVELKAGLSWLARGAHAEKNNASAMKETQAKKIQEDKAAVKAKGNSEAAQAAAAAAKSQEAQSEKAKQSSAALLFEQRKRREVEKVLSEKEREAAMLRKKLALRDAAEFSELSMRDVVTLMRMEPKERSTVSRMAKALGVTSSFLDARAAEPQPPPDNTLAQRTTSIAPAKKATSAGLEKKTATGVKTMLSADAVAGATKVDVASSTGFLVGYKLRVGEKGRAEDRLITGFGSLCFLEPLQHAHVAGEPVIMLKPSVQEKKYFESRAIRDFLIHRVLTPMVAKAANEGQRVLDARKRQASFEVRPIEKHVFCVQPTSMKLLPGTSSPASASSSKQSGGDSGSLVELPTLGQVLVASPSAPSGIAVAREGYPLHKLRRFFDAAKGSGGAEEDAVSITALECALGDARGRYLLGISSSSAGLFMDLKAAIGNDGEDSSAVVPWPAFLAFFCPELVAPQHTTGLDLDAAQRDSGLHREEIADLAAVFVALRNADPHARGGDGISIPDVTVASMELDGETVTEQQVKDFLAASSDTTTNNGHAQRVSFTKFALFRKVAVPRGGYRGMGGWRRSARARLIDLFVELARRPGSTDRGSDGACDPYDTSGWVAPKAALVNRASTDAKLACLLGCLPDASGTLLEALQRLGAATLVVPIEGLPMVPSSADADGGNVDALLSSIQGGNEEEGVRLPWSALERCLYPDGAESQTATFSRPLSFVPCIPDASPTSPSKPLASVYETVVDHRTGQLFVLMSDGELQCWDATSSTCRTSEQVILPERPPPSSRSVDSQRHHTAWRIAFGLDRDLTSSDVNRLVPKQNRAQALVVAKEAASRLLALKPRMQVLLFDPNATVLALNTTAGDGCVCFHEPLTLRRLMRVWLALPPMADFDPCLFQQYPNAFPPSPTETSRGALEKFVYLAAHDLLVASIVGSFDGAIFCAATGTRLATLLGHSANITALMWAARPEYALTGSEEGTIRIWDLGATFLPEVVSVLEPFRADQGRARALGGELEMATDVTTLEAAVLRNSEEAMVGVAGRASNRSQAIARVRALVMHALELTGLRPEWRFGVVSGVFQPQGNHDEMIEVTFENGAVSLGVDLSMVRHPDEARSDLSSEGPDLTTKRPLKLKVGVAVAVWHLDMGSAVRRFFDRFDRSGAGHVSSIAFKSALGDLSDDLDLAEGKLRTKAGGEGAFTWLPEANTTLPRAEPWPSLSAVDAEIVCQHLSDSHGRVNGKAFDRFLRAESRPAASSTGGDGPSSLFEGSWNLRIVPTKWRLTGHKGPVLSLDFLPHSMLLVSSAGDGNLRVWDPTSHPHRLTCPANPKHKKLWPGYYREQPEEWTTKGRPYVCVQEFNLAALPLGAASESASSSHNHVATHLLAGSMDASAAHSRVVLNPQACAEARQMDARVADGKSPSCRGFLFLLDDGELLAVPTTQFEPVFVTLSDSAFFEVRGLVNLAAHDALALRKVFHCRHRVRRVLYAISSQFVSLDALCAALQSTGAAADTSAQLKDYVNADLTIFGHPDDGPNRSVRTVLSRASNAAPAFARAAVANSSKERFERGVVVGVHSEDRTVDVALDHVAAGSSRVSAARVLPADRVHGTSGAGNTEALRPGMRCLVRALLPPHGATSSDGATLFEADDSKVAVGDSLGAANTVEMLHALVSDGNGQRILVTFRVGRVTLLVPAADFDLPRPPAVEASAAELHRGHFNRTLASFRALLPGRLRGVHRRNAAENQVLSEVSAELRDALLTRHEPPSGSNGGATAADACATRAFEVSLRLPLERTFAADVVNAQLFALRVAFSHAATDHRRQQEYDSSGGIESGVSSSIALPVDVLIRHVMRCALSSPMAAHWLGPVLRDGFASAVRECGAKRHGKIGWAELGECFATFAARRQNMPSELLYALLRRFQNLFPADASADEFHCVLLHQGLGPSHPQSVDFMRGPQVGDEASVAPLALSLLVGKSDFVRVLQQMDPVGRIQQQLKASQLLMPQSYVTWLDHEATQEIDVDNPPPQLDQMPYNEQLMAQGLTRVVTDESTVVTGAPPLTFLQRYALMAEAGKWLEASTKLGRRIQKVSAPVLNRGMALLVAPALASAQFPGGALAEARANEDANASGVRGVNEAPAKRYKSAEARTYHPLAVGHPWPSLPAVQPLEGWANLASGAAESVAILEVDGAALNDMKSQAEDGRSEPSMEQITSRRSLLDASLQARSLGRDVPGLAQIWADVAVTSSDASDVEYLPNGNVATGNGMIVRLTDALSAGEAPPRYLVAERLDGWRSLRSLCQGKGFLGTSRGLNALRVWGRQMVETLDALHRKGAVLRDLSAANVFVSPDGQQIKLGAFAHTAALDRCGKVTASSAPLRTSRSDGEVEADCLCSLAPHEVPPEPLTDSGRSVDSWGVGLVLLEAVAGGLPGPSTHTDGFFDFFAALRSSVGQLASSSAMATVEGAAPSHDGCLVLQVPSQSGAKLCTSSILKALDSMTTTALLPRRVGPGAVARDDDSPEALDLARLEQAWASMLRQNGSDGVVLNWSDVRQKAASHFSLLARERGDGEGESNAALESTRGDVMEALHRHDKTNSGVLRPEELTSALRSDLRYPLSVDECAALAQCVRDSKTGLARYPALRPLLAATHGMSAAAAAPCWTLLDVLGACFQLDPRERPVAAGLLNHPFFDLLPADEVASLSDAEAIATAPVPVPRWVDEKIARPLRAIVKALDLAADTSSETSPPPLDLVSLGEVIRVVGDLVQEDVESARGLGLSAYWVATHRPALIDALMRRGTLEALAAIGNRVFALEDSAPLQAAGESSSVSATPNSLKRPALTTVGFLEGDRSFSVAVRLAKRLERLGQSLLLGLQKPAAALAKHAGSVLRFLVMCYAGRSDPPPLCYADVQDSSADEAATWLIGSPAVVDPTTHEGGDRRGAWRPGQAALFRPLLLEAVTEEGGGNWLYPSLRDYMHWCALVADQVIDVDFDPILRTFTCSAGSYAVASASAASTAANTAIGVPFVRTATYYRALVSAASQLDLLAVHGSTKPLKFSGKARAAACSFFGHMCRFDANLSDGRLDSAASQSAQLLVDLGFAKMLRPWLCDAAQPVRANALLCARNAIIGGFRAVTDAEDFVRGPAEALALSFCGLPWVSTLGRVLQGQSQETSSGFTFDDKAHALDCLAAMAERAGVAVAAWPSAHVAPALAAALLVENTKGRSSRQDVSAHKATLVPVTKVPVPMLNVEDAATMARQKVCSIAVAGA